MNFHKGLETAQTTHTHLLEWGGGALHSHCYVLSPLYAGYFVTSHFQSHPYFHFTVINLNFTSKSQVSLMCIHF
jgi:hypothetical protein